MKSLELISKLLDAGLSGEQIHVVYRAHENVTMRTLFGAKDDYFARVGVYVYRPVGGFALHAKELEKEVFNAWQTENGILYHYNVR